MNVPALKTLLALAMLWGFLCPATAAAQERITIQFLSVSPDAATQKSDQALLDYLRNKVPLTFEKQEMNYDEAIQTLKNWDSEKKGPLLARVTPYAFVVAEMLGANMEILGTYMSKKSQGVTGKSFFVVHSTFGYEKPEAPEEFVRHVEDEATQIEDFLNLLKKRENPASFVYHSPFSTSSHFLPSLFFKNHGIYSLSALPKTPQKFITIQGVSPELALTGSDLVPLVKDQKVDFAAVRESHKAQWETDEELKFIPLPYTTPNDLLVVLKPFSREIRGQILETLRKMENMNLKEGDILKWEDFSASPRARKSLAHLRHLAQAPPHPVVVNIRKSQKDESGIDEKHLEAARQAVRLSGNEMVLFEEDFHSAFDVLWTLETRHDGSLSLTSTIMDSGLTQEFPLSFRQKDMANLTSRIRWVIDHKMHRIRYVWPFDRQAARVIRDVDFHIPAGETLKVQKITWIKLSTNEYTIDPPFDVEVTHSDLHSLQLRGKGFPQREDGNFAFEPLGNVSYRVFLERSANAGQMYKITTKVLIGLFGLAALFTLVELLLRTRTPKPPKG